MQGQDLAIKQENRVLSPGGNIIDPTAVNTLMQMAKVWHQSGLLPAHVKTPAQALTIAMMGDALNVNYLTALQELYVVHGKVGTSAKLARALVLRSGLVEDMQLDASPEKATFTVKRKGFSKAHVETVTIEQARKAGWTKNQIWEALPDIMLGERATMRALRKVFPDVVLGLYSHDELGVPVRVGDAETIEIDHEEIKPDPQAPAPAPAPEPEPEPSIGELPSDLEKKQLEVLIKATHADGKAVVMPSERRKISEELLRDGSRANYLRTFEGWSKIVADRMEAGGAQ